MALQACLQLAINKTGKCNAIAFWFELELDEETQLSTSPYCHKVMPSALLLKLFCNLFALRVAPVAFRQWCGPSVSWCVLQLEACMMSIPDYWHVQC